MATSATAVPFSDPPWILGLPSPYYDESHRRWQRACRKFIDEHLTSHAIEWEKEGKVPQECFDTFAKHNMLIPNLSAPLPVQMLKKLGIHNILGILKVEDFSYIHFAIYVSEMRRSGLGGPTTSLITGIAYGAPPIIRYASEELKERLLPGILLGQTRICIGITEPDAGSDVANVQTTATKTSDGRYYIVNGTKKWITNGIWSHYSTMPVRTGGAGPGGLSLLVVPLLNTPGVSMRRLSTIGNHTSGTTYIELDDVRVPVQNLIGKEGDGMIMMMRNLNHERLSISVGVLRQARVALAATFKYVTRREAFGKPLIEQAVVRHRLAKCAGELEAHSAWLDQLVYQTSILTKEESDQQLGGYTALAKARSGMILDDCARCAVLLHGGNGMTKSGQGELVEMIYRDIPAARIPGGSEDVLLDLAMRQVLKQYKRKVKSTVANL